jgi:ribonuclease G
MYKKLLINMAKHETRVALLEDGTIAELFINRNDQADITGNIYKGRIQRVLPGMQAAFVDIGLSQAAFLSVDDIHWEGDGGQGPGLDADPASQPRTSTPIEQLLCEGQTALVYVAKSPMGSKGARVSSYVSLPGRFLVLMPNVNHVGVSRRIEDETERGRLKQLVVSLREDDCGYIVRTAAEGIEAEKIANEMIFLKELWQTIQRKNETVPAPALLHQELDVSLRAVRDLMTHEVEKLVIDSADGYRAVLRYLDRFMPSLKDCVELYEGAEPIFDAYNLEGDISRALKQKVWLKSGGYIVIQQTEALVAIDVNTGRYVGKHNLEETIVKTNLEAVKEIAYQIRLRDIGGIIILDFIDMEKATSREKVFQALKDALRRDRSKTHVVPFSELGLVQMTRKRSKNSLTLTLCEPCLYCEGEGRLLSARSVCYSLYREVLRLGHDMTGASLTLRVNPSVAELLHGEERPLIADLEARIGRPIIVYPEPDHHLEQYEVVENKAEGKTG